MDHDDLDDYSDEGPPPPPPTRPPPGMDRMMMQDQYSNQYNGAPMSSYGIQYEDGEAYNDEESVEIADVLKDANYEEDKEEYMESPAPGRNLLYAGIICCLLVILAIILGVGFGTGAFSSSPASSNSSPTVPPVPPTPSPVTASRNTPEPTSAPITTRRPVAPVTPMPTGTPDPVREEAFTNYLSSIATNGADAFTDSDSPESLASNWLATQDDLRLDPLDNDPANRLQINQRFALASFYYSGNPVPGWLSGQECDWKEVICGQTTIEQEESANVADGGDERRNLQLAQQTVVQLVLKDYEMGGSFPADMALLTDMRILDLSNNGLQGPLPTSVESFTELQYFLLDGNLLTGVLQNINFGVFQSLRYFDVKNNRFQGQIPPSLYNALSLEVVVLEGNRFEGGISQDVGNLLDLQVFVASRNQLQGQIPVAFESLNQLLALEVSLNQLTGGLPDFSGTQLQSLKVDGNALNFAFPDYFDQFDMIRFALGGPDQNIQTRGPIPSWIYTWTKLRELNLQNCKRTGMISDEIGNLKLEVLNLDSNYLSGSIPTTITNLVNMTELRLRGAGDGVAGEFLTGVLPDNVGDLSDLEVLSVYFNEIEGPIPASVSTLYDLVILDIADNLFTGDIPDLSEMTSLERALFSGNPNLSPGPLPIFNSDDLLVIDARTSVRTGFIPTSYTRLPSLAILDLQDNNLQGDIPADIGDLGDLVILRLANAGLGGPFPDSVDSLEVLEILQIEGNEITGEVPSSACDVIGGLNVFTRDCVVTCDCGACDDFTCE